MSKIKTASLFALFVFSAINCADSAMASSPSAWSAHDREIAESCSRASGLNNAAATGKPIIFDDRVGVTALLVTGRYPQPHMKNQPGRVLCLFDRKTREASISPADQLRWDALAKSGKK